MKTLQFFLSENMVTEAFAKNVHLPRKGSTVYILKFGDTVAVPAKVEEVTHSRMSFGKNRSFNADIQLSSNKYGLEGYKQPHFDSINYSDEKYQVISIRDPFDDDYYIGTSKEAIQQYVNNVGNTRLPGLLSTIKQKENELNNLYKQKAEAEAQANLVVTESFNIMESFYIPSFTVSAMHDLLSSKSEGDVTKFFTDQGYNEDDNDSKIIFKSIQHITKECELSYVKANDDIFNNTDKQKIADTYALTKYTCWVIYMTDGDSQMLILTGKTSAAEKVLKDFVKGCDRDVKIITSWE